MYIERFGYFLLQCMGYDFSLDIMSAFLDNFKNFKHLTSDNKLYVTTNINKSFVLMFICLKFMKILSNKPKQLLNGTHISKSEIGEWMNLTSLYVMTDAVSLIRSNNIPRSTQIHHLAVVMAYFIINTLDINKKNLSTALVLYGAYSSIAFLVNLYLGLRKFTDKTQLLKRIAGITYILSCSINWSWQFYYQFNYFNPITLKSMAYCLFSSGLLYSWIQDDIILIKHLIK